MTPTAAASGSSGGRPPTVLEEIDTEECLALMAGEEVGRLVVTGHPPQVFPVNFVLDGRTVLILTAPGAKIDAVRDDAEVAFEVDQLDRTTRSGWSVVVTGTVREELHLHDAGGRPPGPWPPGLRPYGLRIEATTVAGRRIRPAPVA